jgi:hypothetical protein
VAPAPGMMPTTMPISALRKKLILSLIISASVGNSVLMLRSVSAVVPSPAKPFSMRVNTSPRP